MNLADLISYTDPVTAEFQSPVSMMLYVGASDSTWLSILSLIFVLCAQCWMELNGGVKQTAVVWRIRGNRLGGVVHDRQGVLSSVVTSRFESRIFQARCVLTVGLSYLIHRWLYGGVWACWMKHKLVGPGYSVSMVFLLWHLASSMKLICLWPSRLYQYLVPAVDQQTLQNLWKGRVLLALDAQTPLEADLYNIVVEYLEGDIELHQLLE